MIAIALYQPDIPQNAGAILRLGACLGVAVHVIHPIGFTLSDRTLRRAGLDYIARATLVEHDDWTAFRAAATPRRLIALSAHATTPLQDFAFAPDDILLLGRETAGLPPEVTGSCDALLRIPIVPGNRSLNVASAAAIAAFEALRRTDLLPQGS